MEEEKPVAPVRGQSRFVPAPPPVEEPDEDIPEDDEDEAK